MNSVITLQAKVYWPDLAGCIRGFPGKISVGYLKLVVCRYSVWLATLHWICVTSGSGT